MFTAPASSGGRREKGALPQAATKAIPILFLLAYRPIWPLAVCIRTSGWARGQEVVAPAAYLQCKESGVKILSKKAADELIGAAGGVPKCVLHLRRDLHAALRERENLVRAT